jgi:mono/diheme cytochrome c family protein
VLFAALALGCGGGEQEAEPLSAPKPPQGAPAPAPVEPVADAPSPGAEEIAPEPDGAGLYALYCASCHGAVGDGDGPVAQALDPQPARHSDGATMNGLSDDYLFRVIAEGGAAVGKSPLMAPWGGTLDDAQIRALVAYIRTLAKGP